MIVLAYKPHQEHVDNMEFLSEDFPCITETLTESQNNLTCLFLGATTQLLLSAVDPIKYG